MTTEAPATEPLDLEAIRQRLGNLSVAIMIANSDDVADARAALAADVPALLVEVESLRALTATCSCATGPAFEGPQADCAVHGAVRAFNEASRELAEARAEIEEDRRRRVAEAEAQRRKPDVVDALTVRARQAEAERDAMRPVVEKVRAWREARPGPWTGGTDAEFHLQAAWDAYTAGAPGVDTGTTRAETAGSVDVGHISAADLAMAAHVTGSGIRSRDVWVPLEGDALGMATEAAADKLDALLAPATPGPWTTPGPDSLAPWTVYDRQWSIASMTVYDHNEPMSNKPGATGPAYINPDANAAYIAAMNPDVGRALVALLRGMACWYEVNGGPVWPGGTDNFRDLARAILATKEDV